MKLVSKLYWAIAVAMFALIPTSASAAPPSTYVNKFADGIFGEILKVAPKIALVVVGWGVIMYLMSGDEHKKGKYKSTALIAIVAYLVLLVLKPLMTWFSGFMA